MLTQVERAPGTALATPAERSRAAPRPPRLAGVARPGLWRVVADHGAASDVLDALIEALPVGVAMIDRFGHVVWANATMRASWPLDLPAIRRAVGQVFATGSERRLEDVEWSATDARPSGRSGGRRWLDVGIVPVRAGDGRLAAALLTITDVTARVEATDWRRIVETLATL